jgi:hypothetical protein
MACSFAALQDKKIIPQTERLLCLIKATQVYHTSRHRRSGRPPGNRPAMMSIPGRVDKCEMERVRDFPSVEARARKLLCWIALAIVLVTIAVHLGLVDIGQWAYDEFAIISSYRDNGLLALSTRLFHWSPRPISEILIWIYGCLVNWTHTGLS